MCQVLGSAPAIQNPILKFVTPPLSMKNEPTNPVLERPSLFARDRRGSWGVGPSVLKPGKPRVNPTEAVTLPVSGHVDSPGHAWLGLLVPVCTCVLVCSWVRGRKGYVSILRGSAILSESPSCIGGEGEAESDGGGWGGASCRGVDQPSDKTWAKSKVSNARRNSGVQTEGEEGSKVLQSDSVTSQAAFTHSLIRSFMG